jgi:hypothetical protein
LSLVDDSAANALKYSFTSMSDMTATPCMSVAYVFMVYTQ